MAGTFAADVAVTIPNAGLTGTFAVAVNSMPTAASVVLPVGDGTVGLDLPAGPFFGSRPRTWSSGSSAR